MPPCCAGRLFLSTVTLLKETSQLKYNYARAYNENRGGMSSVWLLSILNRGTG